MSKKITKARTKNHNGKILIFDLETAPSLAWTFQMWKANVRPGQIVEHGWIMVGAAKWYGENTVICEKARKIGDDENIVKRLWKLLDEADIVVAHNAKKFDVPVLNARFLFHGLPPPSPYFIVDTLAEAKRRFRFPHNSLEGLANYLRLPVKKDPQTFDLWTDCMSDINHSAWKKMEKYCKGDVITLEHAYDTMLPYMDRHPNMALYRRELEGDNVVCVACASSNLQSRGTAKTKTQMYHRYCCKDCGAWTRERFTMLNPSQKTSIGTPCVVS